MLRAIVLAIGGLFACSAIIVTFTGLWLASALYGPRLEPVDYVQGGVFIVFSLGVLVIAARASLREWRTGKEGGARGLLARAAPVFVAAGLAFGAFAAVSISGERAAFREEGKTSACELAPLLGVEPSACAARAQACGEKLYRQDPPALSALTALQDLAVKDLRDADAAAQRDELGASERQRRATSVLSAFNSPSWSRRYELGMAACVGGLLP